MLQHDMSHKKIILSLSPLYDFVETKTKNTYIPPPKKKKNNRKKEKKIENATLRVEYI